MQNDTLLKAISQELQKRSWHLRFPDTLETRFESDTQQQRSRNMLLAGLVSAVIYSLFLINDYSFRPDAFITAVLLRIGVMLPFGLPVLWWVYRGVSPTLRETLMASTVVVATVVSCVIFTKSTVPYSYLDVFSFGLILLVGNIVYSLRFNYACASSAISIFIILAVVAMYDPMPPEAKRLAIFTIIATALFTLTANYRFERSERTAYLHVLKEKICADYYLKDNQKLSHLSVTDPLTGIANRRHFDVIFPKYWQRALDLRHSLGMVVVDIDHFKAYNDQYGHLQGDNCLRQVSAALKANSRDKDLVVRFGGEEFVVLLANATSGEALHAAERIRESVASLAIVHSDHAERNIVTVSVGAATLQPTHRMDPSLLFYNADQALYEAKRSGRNQCYLASYNCSSSLSFGSAQDSNTFTH
ncbi:MAG: diguanylate cyclase [Halomonas sp.]|nr:diguanylate cyclase [Halomonas sp.]MBP5979971.1 diguanylate cyclase [Halomonas sp.]